MEGEQKPKVIERTIVACIFISSDNKVLLGKKDPNGGGVFVESWHIPGGGLENGEKLLEGLKREMLEETGIDIDGFQTVIFDDKGSAKAEKTDKTTGETYIADMKFIVYIVRIPLKAEKINTERNDDLVILDWFDLIQLQQLFDRSSLTPPSMELFRRKQLASIFQ